MAYDGDLTLAFHELRGISLRRGPGVFPTVLGVGAGRCGTTSLYNVFRKTPTIYVPPVKEVNFFGQPRLSKEIYSLYFCMSKDELHRSEISPYYLHQQGVAEQIHDFLGKIKIVVQIREPVDRFISHYKHHLPIHKITDFSAYLNQALDLYRDEILSSRRWFLPEKAISQSLYFNAIARYVDLFGTANVLVIDYRELKTPDRFCVALSRFLGVEIESDTLSSSNESNSVACQIKDEDIRRLLEFLGDDYQKTLDAFAKTYEMLCANPA